MKQYLNEVFEKVSGFNVWGAQTNNSDIIGLSWADPFYPNSTIDEDVKKACIHSLENNAVHYSYPIGLTEMRVAAAEKVLKTNGMKIDPTLEIVIVPGADTGLFYAMMPFISPGDEILILEPSYACNYNNAHLLGAVPVRVELNKDDFSINFDNLEKAITAKTKMLVLTNPNNPTGRSYTLAELTKLADFVTKHDIIVVVDQAFEDSVYSGYEMNTFAAIDDMHKRTVTVYSMSKGYGMCGFRVGYIVSNEKFIAAMGRYIVAVCGAPNTMAQHGAIEALKHSEIIERNRERFEERSMVAYDILTKLDFIKCVKPQAGFYLWIDVSAIGNNSEVCAFVKEDAKIAITSGAMYGGENSTHIRVVTAAINDDDKFAEVINILKNSLEKMYINNQEKL